MKEFTQEELQEAIEFRNKLFYRRQEVLEIIKTTTDPNEKIRQQLRAKALMGMYRDAAQRVKELKSYFSNKKKVELYKQRKSTNIDIAMMMGNVWADLSGVTWGEMSNYTWGREKLEQDTEENSTTKYLYQIIRQAINLCTDRQRFYMTQYYGVGKTYKEIAEENHVNQSTVQRTTVRGLRHISDYICAKLIMQKCIDKNGYFDYILFVNSCNLLTDRQKEIMYLILCTDNNQTRIAEFIDRHVSGTTRALDRIVRKLNNIAIEMNMGYSSIRVKKEDLRLVSEKKLAEDLGLSPMFYYSICKRGKMINSDIPMHRYVIWKYIVEQPNARNREIAKYMGCSEGLVDKVRKQYKGKPFPEVPIAQYNRKEVKKVYIPENPYAIFNGDFIIKAIDNNTIEKLSKMKEAI